MLLQIAFGVAAAFSQPATIGIINDAAGEGDLQRASALNILVSLGRLLAPPVRQPSHREARRLRARLELIESGLFRPIAGQSGVYAVSSRASPRLAVHRSSIRPNFQMARAIAQVITNSPTIA